MKRQFASDNYSGICPEVWGALQKANQGHAPSYGHDEWTARASDLLRETFERDCEVFFVFNGTAANSLALASLCQSYHSVICHQKSHIETDECGAPEFYSNGTKILLVPGANGKVDLDAVRDTVKRRTDIHYPKPRVLSITQATEYGTVYSVNEVRTACKAAKKLGLGVHMDGARFANAIASLRVKPKDITWKAGVDVLCLGGTKNGMPVGDAVIFFDRNQAHEFDYRCKQAGQLASKMRFIAAGWIGLLKGGSWLKHAAHANRCARLLANELGRIKGVKICFPCEANALFIELPPAAVKRLAGHGWTFYQFIGPGAMRLMCSWDTTVADVKRFAADVRLCLR